MCLSVPGQVTEIADAGRCLATVDCDGGPQVINLMWLVDAARPIESWIGTWVCFHSGFATMKIDAETASMLSMAYSPP